MLTAYLSCSRPKSTRLPIWQALRGNVKIEGGRNTTKKTRPAQSPPSGLKTDFSPGRYASETGRWYFSCDQKQSVVVGIKDDVPSTCPIMGLREFEVPFERIQRLRQLYRPKIGGAYGLYVLPGNEVGRILGLPIDADDDRPIVFVVTDRSSIVEIHTEVE